MRTRTLASLTGGSILLIAVAVLGVRSALAHCDGLDGPVVRAAEEALATGNVNLALIWVHQEVEEEVREAFMQAAAVRRLGPEAQVLADRSFFETLVRLHRAGEGAPYTGLKPAGSDLGPAIPAADRALETGAVRPLERLLTEAVRHGLHEHYEAVQRLKNYDPDDVAAGRRYVEAYVAYVHFVERLYQAATGAAEGHHAEGGH